MPKQKTKSSAKKRFKLTGTGKIKRKHAFKSHILTKKSKKRKLALTHDGLVDKSDESNVKSLSTVTNLDTMVVVLYLEYFCKEETPCTSTDCDTQGEGQSAKVRMLLISKDVVQRISNKDNDSIFDAHNNFELLPFTVV